MIYSNSKRIDSERMSSEIIKLKDRILGYQEPIRSLKISLRKAEKTKTSQKQSYETVITEKDAIIKELKTELAHAALNN